MWVKPWETGQCPRIQACELACTGLYLIERDVGLPSDGFCNEGFADAGLPLQQDALGRLGPQRLVAPGIVQKLHAHGSSVTHSHPCHPCHQLRSGRG